MGKKQLENGKNEKCMLIEHGQNIKQKFLSLTNYQYLLKIDNFRSKPKPNSIAERTKPNRFRSFYDSFYKF